jgi:hypothetical protein
MERSTGKKGVKGRIRVDSRTLVPMVLRKSAADREVKSQIPARSRVNLM